MAWMSANEIPLGTVAPNFSLSTPDGEAWSLDRLAEARGILITFMSARCSYMKHIGRGFSAFARECAAKGLGIVAINANARETLEEMAAESARFGYVFPYVKDFDQSVATAYKASCTPDFYLFDMDRRLYYHGEFDDSAPGNTIPVTGAELRKAVESLFAGQSAPALQKEAYGGCIDWSQPEFPTWMASG